MHPTEVGELRNINHTLVGAHDIHLLVLGVVPLAVREEGLGQLAGVVSVDGGAVLPKAALVEVKDEEKWEQLAYQKHREIEQFFVGTVELVVSGDV